SRGRNGGRKAFTQVVLCSRRAPARRARPYHLRRSLYHPSYLPRVLRRLARRVSGAGRTGRSSDAHAAPSRLLSPLLKRASGGRITGVCGLILPTVPGSIFVSR